MEPRPRRAWGVLPMLGRSRPATGGTGRGVEWSMGRGAVNGEGNLVIGYAEDTSGHSQSGSHDLVVGSENGWKSYGEIVGGFQDQANGAYATAVGNHNAASGPYSLAAGDANRAIGAAS